MDLIDIRQLHCGLRLQNVSLSLRTGEMLGVIGPNGSGKSSLLQCIAGLLDYSGEIRFEGKVLGDMPHRQRARHIGYQPQSAESAWALSVEDVVALGRLPWGDQDPEAIRQAVRQTGIEALLDRRVDRLSGGEQARVWLARVLAGQPRVLLADEPIASLDLLHQRSVMDALRAYADGGQGVMLAIHDFGLAARYCDRLCLMRNGAVHALGTPAEVLTEAHLSEVFQVPVYVDLKAVQPVVALK
ncbi:MAG: ABC transporter ATP-binding protein [Burkholderiaceae bacterium]